MTDNDGHTTLETHISRTFWAGMVAGLTFTTVFAVSLGAPDQSLIATAAMLATVTSTIAIPTAAKHYTAQKAETVRKEVDLEREAQAGNVEEIVDEYVEGELDEYDLEARLGDEIFDDCDSETELVMER